MKASRLIQGSISYRYKRFSSVDKGLVDLVQARLVGAPDVAFQSEGLGQFVVANRSGSREIGVKRHVQGERLAAGREDERHSLEVGVTARDVRPADVTQLSDDLFDSVEVLQVGSASVLRRRGPQSLMDLLTHEVPQTFCRFFFDGHDLVAKWRKSVEDPRLKQTFLAFFQKLVFLSPALSSA